MSESKLIQSIIRASQIIDCFSSQRFDLSLIEISEMTGLNKSTLFGIIKTLEYENYIIQDPVTKKYRLGLKFVTKGAVASASYDIITVAAPSLKRLNQKYHEATSLFLYENHIIRCVYSLGSNTISAMKTELGAELPFFSSASGQAILASYDKSKINQIIKAPEFLRYISDYDIDETKYIESILNNRKNGFSIENGEVEKGVSSIAVTIDCINKVKATISVTGMTANITAKFSELASDLLAEKQTINRIC